MSHLYINFRKKFSEKLLKEVIWKVAKSTYPQGWEREINAIRVVSEEAYIHMMKSLPMFWSKSQFSTHRKCDSVFKNMSEAFNIMILDSRANIK